MNFLEKLLKNILQKNLIIYNFLVTLITLLIFFGIFYLGILLILALQTAAPFNDPLLSTLIAPIILGILDFAFCLFILIVNLKFRNLEIEK